MAKTSGGIRGSSAPKKNSGNKKASVTSSVKISKGTTEAGYTSKMVRNIVGIEQKYRNNRDETAHFFDAQGNKITSIGGKGAKVDLSGAKIPENSIMTHNHPRSIGTTGIRRIGNSLSSADMASAVFYNAKEIRAVTPTYTFSVKRPAGGWGVTTKQVMKEYSKANSKVKSEMYGYLNKTGWSDTSIARAETTHVHKVMKDISKKFGWIYTKKRG